jgi:hypothetical protein
MGRLLGLAGLLAATVVGVYLYSRQAQHILGTTNTAAPSATINVIGIRNDLLALANAERSHFALEGKYVSLDELRSSRDISMKTSTRGPCSYVASVTETSFRIKATCSDPAVPGTPSVFSIDETMQIHSD